jgi:hypothetical protein
MPSKPALVGSGTATECQTVDAGAAVVVALGVAVVAGRSDVDGLAEGAMVEGAMPVPQPANANSSKPTFVRCTPRIASPVP